MKKKLLYVLIILILLVVGYLTYNYVRNYTKKKEPDVIKDDTTPKEVDNEFQALSYNGYLYVLPQDTFYEILNDNPGKAFRIYNNVDGWNAIINLIDKQKQTEADLFDDYDKLELDLKNESTPDNSYTVENRNVFSNNNINAVSFEIHGSKSNSLVAYMPAYDNYEYGIKMACGNDSDFNYDSLFIVLSILSVGVKEQEQ